MSVLAGIYYFDRRPITSALSHRMTEALRRYVSDEPEVHIEPGLLMVCQVVHVTPEDESARQPLVSRRGTVLVWDGRLDNRGEICRAFGSASTASDAELVLEAYDIAGQDVFHQLIGDWSLVVWQPRERTLVLASDYMGVRPLCYRHEADFVAWSSSAEFLLELTGACEIDEEFVVGHLTYSAPPDHTPYSGVLSVSPAHAISFAATKPPVKRAFWDLPHRSLRYSDERDYDEHFRQVLADAVRVRLRSSGPVWAELSGGLDSSAIVCIADELLRNGKAADVELATISRFSPTSIGSDERRFIRVVQEQVKRPEVYVALDECLIESLRSTDATWPRRWGAEERELELMEKAGAKVLLSGRLGDAVMGNMVDDSISLASHLRRGALGTLVREARLWALATRQPIAHVLGAALVPLLPLSWQLEASHRDFLRRHQGTRPSHVGPACELFSVKPTALESMRERLRTYLQKALTYPELSKRQLVTVLCRYSVHRELESPTRAGSSATTYPYSHRPLVEFVMSIPQHVLVGPGEPRLLMKRALAGTVPSRILQRFSKSTGNTYKARCVKVVGGHLLTATNELEVVER